MRRLAAPFAIGMLAFALAGCATGAPPPGPTQQSGSGGSDPTSTPAGPPPVFVPGGSADENKPYFDRINEQTLAADPKAGSHALVDGLAAAGFPKSEMEVTFDRTSVDLEADYIIVSVKMGGRCLIGQRSPTGYASEVAAPVSDGKCLIGATQTIDW